MVVIVSFRCSFFEAVQCWLSIRVLSGVWCLSVFSSTFSLFLTVVVTILFDLEQNLVSVFLVVYCLTCLSFKFVSFQQIILPVVLQLLFPVFIWHCESYDV